METIKFTRSRKKERRVYREKTEVFDLCNGTGFLVCICLISYFLTMRTLGVHEILHYRMLNIVFLFSGIVICYFIHSHTIQSKINYLKGIRMGLHVTIVAVIPFTAFMFFYLNFDDTFMDIVEKKAELSTHVCPGNIAWVLAEEGLCSGVIISAITMQFFKKRLTIPD